MLVSSAIDIERARSNMVPFEERLRQANTQLRRRGLEVVQINVGRLCNQACLHCHLAAGPTRTEVMDRRTAELALAFVRAVGPSTVDLTGGAPELNPSFRFLVEELHRLGFHTIDRSNLTVFFEPAMEDLPAFLARHRVEVTASLPCYTQENVDAQRGTGVYDKSMAALARLNDLGYGKPGSGLVLNLVYNPGCAALPGDQAGLETDYRRELMDRFGLVFNRLFTLTNVDLGRFTDRLDNDGAALDYAALISQAFNPDTLDSLMCLSQVSVSWDGHLYDCDFNQALDLRLGDRTALRLGEQEPHEIARVLHDRAILTGRHCYACTAGSGSSCSGTLVMG